MAKKSKSLKLDLDLIPTDEIQIETTVKHPIERDDDGNPVEYTLTGTCTVPVTSAELDLETIASAVVSKDKTKALVRSILRQVRVDISNTFRKNLVNAWRAEQNPVLMLQAIMSGKMQATREQKQSLMAFIESMTTTDEDDE